MSRQELAATCQRELADAMPGLPAPEWSQVIAEKLATLACTGRGRYFSPDTPVEGLHFAGDYTYSRYPPTLESAVRSGVLAAQALMEKT